MKTLTLETLIQRNVSNREVIEPLLKYLDLDIDLLNRTSERDAALAIAQHLRKMGSNDFATLFRGGEGVPYAEVVVDVGQKLKADVSENRSVEHNEERILLKLFADSLEQMTEEEKRAVLRSIGIKERDIPVGALSAAVIQGLLKQFGGFYIYQITMIVANMVAKALLGSGLSFATNALLTRSLGAFLGPIGWIASGLWLALDLAGPAYRKTVPAVIHLALLRQITVNRINIGVVGDGSSGKDSLITAVFGLETDIDPVAGSTSTLVKHPLGEDGSVHVINYPGFNDYRQSVNAEIDEQLNLTDLFVLVVDINRGISGNDIKILENLQIFKKPILICLNKADLPRSEQDRDKLEEAAMERLPKYPMITTAFDPDPRLQKEPIGAQEVFEWLKSELKRNGKNVDESHFSRNPKR